MLSRDFSEFFREDITSFPMNSKNILDNSLIIYKCFTLLKRSTHFPILYPLKNFWLSGVFREHKMRAPAKNGLTLSWTRFLSYRNLSIDLLCKSMDWFLYDRNLRHERDKPIEWLNKLFWCTHLEVFWKIIALKISESSLENIFW